jgi:hypothetical protein
MCHVPSIPIPLERPPRIVYATGVRGPVSRLGVPTPARFDGELSKRTTILRGTAKQSGSLQASGRGRHRGVGAFCLGFEPGPTGGAWGQAATASGEEFEQRGAPVRSAHCIRVSPDPGESWSTAMGSGRRHRQVQRRELQGKITSISRYDAPQERLGGAGEGFSPAVSHA